MLLVLIAYLADGIKGQVVALLDLEGLPQVVQARTQHLGQRVLVGHTNHHYSTPCSGNNTTATPVCCHALLKHSEIQPAGTATNPGVPSAVLVLTIETMAGVTTSP